jgi:hypothetical protein
VIICRSFLFFLGLFDFRRNPLTFLEVDYALADCYRALGPDRKLNLFLISDEKTIDRRLSFVF